ncbi:MAG TPA: anhydro-N-acetylmuramic acid kinase [Verrucomicrobiae bacterium]|jgi:anhydro-N-acetylmuramic acid kinase
MRVLGIMSGTSIDGVDYALCEVERTSIRLLKHSSRSFPKELQRRLHAAAANESAAHELAQLHHDLGRLYASQAKQLNSGAALVGLHGQTVFHNPNRRAPATLQIGEPAYLAEALRVPIVSDFRAGDIAAGGQGAPLATLFHKIVFARHGQHVCVNNLGGISNVTSLDWRSGREPKILSFDTGPANVLIDLAVRKFTRGKKAFDRGGMRARRGSANEELLKQWLKHPFFKAPPPKSTGREVFGEAFWRRVPQRLSESDAIATLTEFAARSLALNYKLHLPSAPDSMLLCGGGAKNPTLVARIDAALRVLNGSIKVIRSESSGWPAQAIEAAAFALLAYYRWREWPANMPATTGARRPALLGQVTI